ncbi:MAG: TolC family protein [Chloracidobacterium sp.]|nr:TolC family protein [Chloracidobacterium sp.]MDW8218601.1 TolC family protein [Acidobacteriota bacterium]
MPYARIICRLLLLIAVALFWTPPATYAQAASPMAVTVEQAVAETLQRNLNLLAERYEIPRAEAEVIAARLRPNPVLSLGGDHLDLLGTGYNAINNAGPAEYSARVDWPLERPSKRRARISAAEYARAAAEYRLQDAMRRLALEAQLAFVELQAAKESLALARANQQTFEELVAVNAARVRAGDLAPIELVRTRVSAVQLTQAVTQAETRWRVAQNRLQTLMGRAEALDVFEAVGDMRRDPPPPSLSPLLAKALDQRPDLRALRADQARTLADLKLQIAQGKIEYTVGVEYRRQQGLAGTGNSLGLFLSLPLTIYDRNQGGIARAQAEVHQTERRIAALERELRAELEAAYLQCRAADAVLKSYEGGLLEQARDVLEVTEYAYRRGEASFVEFLDAQRTYNETMQGYIDARAEYARLRFTLDRLAAEALP